MNTQVLGISIDHVPCLEAWSKSLGEINYPLLSDFWPHGKVAIRYGVLRPQGDAERAIFILDRQGIIRYIDIHDIDHQPENGVLLDELRRIDPQAAATEPPEPKSESLPSGGIVLYCSQWCPDCKRARVWLDARGLAYTEVDVSGRSGAAAQVRSWADGKLVTPTFDIDGTIVVNMDEARLEQLLG